MPEYSVWGTVRIAASSAWMRAEKPTVQTIVKRIARGADRVEGLCMKQ